MKNTSRLGVFLFISIGITSAGPAGAQDVAPASSESASPPRVLATTTTECLPGARSIHDIIPQVAFNDFDGHGQTVAALGYSFSRCIGESPNRWFAQASLAHVDEAGFRADAALFGLGLELHPFRNARQFALSPVVRIGREDFSPGGGNTIYNAALTISDVMPLKLQRRRIQGRDVWISAVQFEWAARAEYTSRSPTGSSLVGGSGSDALTFFGSVGLDYALGRSNWRSKASLAYQVLDGGPVDGFVSLGLSVRPVNPSYTSYAWNFGVSGQLGDSGFRGLLLTLSRHFSQ